MRRRMMAGEGGLTLTLILYQTGVVISQTEEVKVELIFNNKVIQSANVNSFSGEKTFSGLEKGSYIVRTSHRSCKTVDTGFTLNEDKFLEIEINYVIPLVNSVTLRLQAHKKYDTKYILRIPDIYSNLDGPNERICNNTCSAGQYQEYSHDIARGAEIKWEASFEDHGAAAKKSGTVTVGDQASETITIDPFGS